MPQITLKIPNIHCASCAGVVTETLKGVPGVQDAQVSFATRSAVVEMREIGSSPPISGIVQALEAIGYPGQVVTQIQEEEVQKEMLAEGRWWIACIRGIPECGGACGLETGPGHRCAAWH